jgi:Family of unknown function (DUF5999)
LTVAIHYEGANVSPSTTMPWPRPGAGISACPHQPSCPSSDERNREAARAVARHPEQGWSLLCNGIVTFDDTGELLPNGGVVAPHRPTDPVRPAL